METISEGATSKKPKFHENLNIPPNFEPLVERNYWPWDHHFQFEPTILCLNSEKFYLRPSWQRGDQIWRGKVLISLILRNFECDMNVLLNFKPHVWRTCWPWHLHFILGPTNFCVDSEKSYLSPSWQRGNEIWRGKVEKAKISRKFEHTSELWASGTEKLLTLRPPFSIRTYDFLHKFRMILL